MFTVRDPRGRYMMTSSLLAIYRILNWLKHWPYFQAADLMIQRVLPEGTRKSSKIFDNFIRKVEQSHVHLFHRLAICLIWLVLSFCGFNWRSLHERLGNTASTCSWYGRQTPINTREMDQIIVYARDQQNILPHVLRQGLHYSSIFANSSNGVQFRVIVFWSRTLPSLPSSQSILEHFSI